jgi:hypothetical protein
MSSRAEPRIKPFGAAQLEAAIRDLKDQAMTLILGAAAAADPTAAEPEAALVADATRFVAAAKGVPPMTCCSELNKLPRRFCAVPTGAGVAAVLVELDVEAGSNGEPFLCPWPPWP